jgi:hypothetical protein
MRHEAETALNLPSVSTSTAHLNMHDSRVGEQDLEVLDPAVSRAIERGAPI